MLQRARSSYLLQHADVRYLPNPIDTQLFTRADSSAINRFRNSNFIDNNSILLVYGAIGGNKNVLKGGAILDAAVAELKNTLSPQHMAGIVFVDFGGVVADGDFHGFRSISLGHIKDPDKLATLYSAADCIVVPSMVESFGQVAAEALSCGTPVVSFDCSGLKDIVIDGKTGLLAQAFNVKSLAKQLLAMIQLSAKERRTMGNSGRAHVMANFSFDVVAKQYVNILHDAVQLKQQ
jgi:glycosyltransferase involved in cell wall biosynthesis